jgi:hypothetical protein
MRNVSDKSCRENQNKHFLFNNVFLSKIVLFMAQRGKYCRAGQATDGNMAHAHCMMQNLWLQTHTQNM